MKKISVIMALLLAFIMLAAGCSAEQTEQVADDAEAKVESEAAETEEAVEEEVERVEELVYGAVDGDVYYNPFFALSIDIPDGWSFPTVEELNEYNGIESEDELVDATIPTIFGAMDSDEFATLSVEAEIIDGLLYDDLQGLAEFEYQMIADIYEEAIEAEELILSDIEDLTIDGKAAKQYSYEEAMGDDMNYMLTDIFVEVDGYFVNITTTYFDDDAADIAAVEEIISSISFK